MKKDNIPDCKKYDLKIAIYSNLLPEQILKYKDKLVRNFRDDLIFKIGNLLLQRPCLSINSEKC